MKMLFVLRHAKAERDSKSGEDFDRPLAKRGWRNARLIGSVMRKRGLDPDLCVASPAKRAAETVTAFSEGYGPLEVSYDRRIYNASLGQLLEIVREASDGSERLLLVGHNPGFQELVLELSGDDEGDDRVRIADGFPTAAIAGIELPSNHWRDVEERTGRIVALILPRDLE